MKSTTNVVFLPRVRPIQARQRLHRLDAVQSLGAGDGLAGVETVEAMNDYLRETVRYFPELESDTLHVVLVHSGRFVLPELGERLGTRLNFAISAELRVIRTWM